MLLPSFFLFKKIMENNLHVADIVTDFVELVVLREVFVGRNEVFVGRNG